MDPTFGEYPFVYRPRHRLSLHRSARVSALNRRFVNNALPSLSELSNSQDSASSTNKRLRLSQTFPSVLERDTDPDTMSPSVTQTRFVLHAHKPQRAPLKNVSPLMHFINNGSSAVSAGANDNLIVDHILGYAGDYVVPMDRIYAAVMPTPNPATLSPNFRQMYFNFLEEEIMLKNDSNAIQMLHIYIYEPRTSATQGGSDLLGTFGSQVVAGSSSVTAPGGTVSQYTYGVNPYDSTGFCRAYKILKVLRVPLAPGQVHIHKNRMYVKRTVGHSDFGDLPANVVRGLSLCTMLMVNGTPVGSVTGSACLSAVSLLMTVTKNIEFSYYDAQTPGSYVVDSLPAANPTTSISDVNCLTGVLQNFAAV